MFVTDTVDAVHSSDEWQPESLMDRLAELISESSHHSKVSFYPFFSLSLFTSSLRL